MVQVDLQPSDANDSDEEDLHLEHLLETRDQRREIIDVCRDRGPRGQGERPDDGVEPEVPEEGAGRPAHAQPTEQRLQCAQPPVPGVADGSHACEGLEGADEPLGKPPGFHAAAEPRVTESLEGFALVGEEDSRVEAADFGMFKGKLAAQFAQWGGLVAEEHTPDVAAGAVGRGGRRGAHRSGGARKPS